MEQAAEYGKIRFKTCVKCAWTGPLSVFRGIPALIEECEEAQCPYCGTRLPMGDGLFEACEYVLPDNFEIVSGGQTGVDRGALDAAIGLGIPHRGWCPKGRKAEDGPIPEEYNMQEMPDTRYWKRTEQNVLDSDGTLVFPGRCESKGTALTIRMAQRHGRPVAVVPLDDISSKKAVAAWLGVNKIRVLNVAGPRESGSPGICARTRDFLTVLLSTMRL